MDIATIHSGGYSAYVDKKKTAYSKELSEAEEMAAFKNMKADPAYRAKILSLIE